MGKSYVVIGLGRLGMSVLKTLSKYTTHVVGIDISEQRVGLASQVNEKCFICDSTKKRVLEELGVKTIDHAIVTIGNNLNATILTTINLKELGVKKITVRVDDAEYIDVLTRLGANEVIDPETDLGEIFAKQALSDTIKDYYPIDDNYAIVQVSVPVSFKAISIRDLNSRNAYGVNIVGLIRNECFFIPRADDLIKPNDIIMLVGKEKQLHNFDSVINK